MQKHRDGTVVVSATDLVGFLACDHLTTQELGAATGLWERPHQREDPEVRLLQERGEAHERAFLERQRDQDERSSRSPGPSRGHRTATARPSRRRSRRCGPVPTSSTRRPCSTGAGSDTPTSSSGWTARARSSAAGATRSPTRSSPARSRVRPSSRSASTRTDSPSSRTCAPHDVHVVTGDGRTNTLRLDDYAAYYRSVRRRFEAEVFGDGGATSRPATASTYPDPVEHCRVCAWFPVCMDASRRTITCRSSPG